MTEPMTLEEAVAACPIIPCNYESETLTMLPVNVARTLKAHAERTIEARSGEPIAVQTLRRIAGSNVTLAYLDTLTAERDAAREERDEAQRNYAFMVERAANEKLDGYRELGARAAAAENDRDRLAASVERVRGLANQTSRFSGIVSAAALLAALEATDG